MTKLKSFYYIENNQKVMFKAENAANDVLINPKLPAKFFFTTNEDRPKSHQKYWNLPFIIVNDSNYQVFCLDGGAWDRPTMWGYYKTLDEALNCAKTGPAWRKKKA